MDSSSSVIKLGNGKFADYLVLEITEIPTIEILPQFQNILDAQQSSHQTTKNLLSTLSREMMYLRSSASHNKPEFSLELVYLTFPVQNQRYLANIRPFFVIRVVSRDPGELVSLKNQISRRFESMLGAMEYSYTTMDSTVYSGLVIKTAGESVTAVIKDDRIHQLQSPTFPQCYSFDRIGAMDNTRKNLFYSLNQHPKCAVAFQLIPAQYNDSERALVNSNAQLLENLLKGVSDQGFQVSISYTTARKDAQTYSHYADEADDGLFAFNVVVMGPRESVADLSRSVIQEFSGSQEYRSILKSLPLNMRDLDLNDNLATFPWWLSAAIQANNYNSVGTANYSKYARLQYLISSGEAAELFLLPIGDQHIGAGFVLNESRRANRSYAKGIIDGGDITIGAIRPSARHSTIGIKLNDLTKHMLVSGTPGSGKTTFLISLLDRLWKEHNIPFLVIEPAKNEYRAMLKSIPDLQVFTPGKSDISPFAFNPFQPPANVRLETFKPSLLTAFAAAVIMSSPLDKIFEESINDCYGNFRWFDHYTIADKGEIFNVADFILAFERQIETIGYTGEARNIGRAGLVRLKALSNLFDYYFSIPIEHLIKRPTVIELSGVESSDQKALIIALILIFILSYINSNRLGDGVLKNIILLEEAHVLMDAQSGNRVGEADPAAIAQRLIRRMLAEIRSYGTGMILADQSPRKVGVDIVALTDIKLTFRLVEAEDKLIIANSTGMNETQMARLSNFKPGEACLFFGKLDEPEEVIIPDYRKEHGIDISLYDHDLRGHINYWKKHAQLLRPYPECRVVESCRHDCDITTKIISKEVARRLHLKYVSGKIVSLGSVKNLLKNLEPNICAELNDERLDERMYACTKVHLLRQLKYQNLIKRTLDDPAEKPKRLNQSVSLEILKKGDKR